MTGWIAKMKPDYKNENFANDGGYVDLPPGLNLLVRCERSETGTVLVLRVPKDITPTTFGNWCVDNVPLGFHPAISIATDEQTEAMGY
jgi:hypothetical protein